MKKTLFVVFALFLVTNLAMAVAIDDSITPQNCDRTNGACAHFVDTSSAGQIKWGGLVAGGLRSLTNLFTDGKVGIGTLRPNTGEQALRLDVNGAVGAKFYCDESGNHCVAGDQLGGGGGPTVGLLFNGKDGITINRNTTTSAYEFSLDPTFVQRRVNGFCETGKAITKVNQDGTVECQAVSGGNADSLWASSGSNIHNLNNGNVGIGTASPSGVLEVKQNTPATPENHQPVAKFTDAWGKSSYIGLNGNGADFSGNQGVYAESTTAGGFGITAAGLYGGESYGGRFIGSRVGSLSTGLVGIYASDLAHKSDRGLTPGYIGDLIPTKLLNDSKQYAGYFDGNVNINGTLTVNGQPLSGAGTNYWNLVNGTLETSAAPVYTLKSSDNWATLNLVNMNNETAQIQGGMGGMFLNAAKITFRALPSYNELMTLDANGLNVKGKITENGKSVADIAKDTYKIGEYCGAFTSGDAIIDTSVPCQGQNIYKGGDKTNRNNFSCPAKFTLVGGDFQNSGNRYFYACVRSSN